VSDDSNFAKQFPQYAHHPPGVIAFALFVKVLVRYGWILLAGVLMIAWLLDWAGWRTLLAIGIAGLLVIGISPGVLGVVGAVAGRRQAMKKQQQPPDDENSQSEP
jgi:hypothetical protein